MNYGINALGAVLLTSSIACDRSTRLFEDEAEVNPSRPESAEEHQSEAATTDSERMKSETVREGAHGRSGIMGDDDDSFDDEDRAESLQLVASATETLAHMRKDSELEALLRKAKGILLIPQYGQGAALVGARGGEGVLLTHHNEKWSGPYFFDVGGVSLGVQAGAEVGEMAVLLMTDNAMDSFKRGDGVSLNAGAHLTLADYSQAKEAPVGNPDDVVFWSNVEGVFAGASLSVTDVDWDEEENMAYYGQPIGIQDALVGSTASPQARLEKQLLTL